jgi:very-short-patch-repair endonuclease
MIDNNYPRNNRIRGVQPEVQETARLLRKEPTPAERTLWEELRDKRLAGLKFRRQHAVGQVILDFYCPSCRLAVEVDGSIHDARTEEDQARTEHLALYGYKVLRFRNEEVLTNVESVLVRILEASEES